MAISERPVQVATCNACGKKRYAENGEPIIGVSGTVDYAVTSKADGQPFLVRVTFFSCSHAAGHIGKAINAVVDNGEGEPIDTR